MKSEKTSFFYEVYDNATELPAVYNQLLEQAKNVTAQAYAPYSEFYVGAAALLENGATITATNQENASSPAGICAERTLLSAVPSVYPNISIKAIAISYSNQKTGLSLQPVFPCGICRQSLLEQQTRQQLSIQLILAGLEGKVIVIPNAADLLPFGFSGKDMK